MVSDRRQVGIGMNWRQSGDIKRLTYGYNDNRPLCLDEHSCYVPVRNPEGMIGKVSRQCRKTIRSCVCQERWRSESKV